MPVSNTDPQGVYSDQGIRTQYGIILPPGARVAAYVRSTGAQSGDDAFLVSNLSTTLAAGLAKVRPNLGDYVIVLPGHVENVVDATTFSGALIAGTKIIGVGKGGNTPTFTWTVATAQWAVNVNDVVIAGLRIQPSSSTSITTAINVAGNDFGFYYNEIITSNSTAVFFNAINFSGTASRFDIANNVARGGTASTGSSSQCIVVACTGDSGRICDNELITTTFNNAGAINVTGATTNLKILRNTISNTVSASICGISYSNVACTGQCANNTITVLNTGAQVSGTTGITVGGTNNLTGYFQNFVVNDPNKSGILQPVADT
jgi:hypothetical protein